MFTAKTIFSCFTMIIAALTITATPSSTPEDRQLRQKIGQLLMVGMHGTELTPDAPITKHLQNLNLGSIILFTQNITGKEQLKKLTAQLQQTAPTPLFIAVDAEGGKVNRLKPELGFSSIPSAQDMGKGTPAQTRAIVSMLAEQLAQGGCNVNLAPVVCVNVNPDCPIIGKLGRSFSANPQDVINHATAFIQAHHKYNIVTALKHFPGHGSSTTDSHKGFTDVTATYKPEELIPYQQLIAAGLVDMIMSAHIINKNIDPTYPATLSPNFITTMLREQLRFDGVVISDCLSMGAIRNYFSFEDAIIRAINAGCDILIISGNIANISLWAEQEQFTEIPTQASDIIFNAVKQGKITQERIEQAFNRVINLKRKFGIISSSPTT